MTVEELKQILNSVDGTLEVRIPMHGDEFDGWFYSPCPAESGVSEMGIDAGEEDAKEAALLGKPMTDKCFLLLPHGFSNQPPISPNQN
jgi:hypothetical protein